MMRCASILLLSILFISALSSAVTSNESSENILGLRTTPDNATAKYFVQHTMIRIKDPKVSLDFYSRILGMSLLKRSDLTEFRISTYLMGYEDTTKAPMDPRNHTAWAFSRGGAMELAHYWGTESNSSFTGYHNGNTEPLGYGHIAINVDDVQEAIKRFESLGVEFVMKPADGNGVAFIQDPDGYWIEIFDIASILRVVVDNNVA
ncbi:Lactoylglutathione lyase [Orobanche gracilis]